MTWPNGIAPVMSAAPGAVDVYYLDTYDGATWYGRAVQPVSATTIADTYSQRVFAT